MHRGLIARRLSSTGQRPITRYLSASSATIESVDKSASLKTGQDSGNVVSGTVHRKSRDIWGRRVKWSVTAAIAGAGAYLFNENFGTPEKTASFFFRHLQQADSLETQIHILNAMQMGAATSDAVKEGIVYSGGLTILKDLLANPTVDLRRLAAAIIMDVTQNPSLTSAVAGCPGLLKQIITNVSDQNKEVAMNSLLTLTIICGNSSDDKLRAFEAGALPKLIGSVRNPDMDIAHVSCTAIGSIVKGFPQPDRLTASLSKKDRLAVVAAISQLGQSYVQQGLRPPAIDAFRTCLVLDPANPNIHNVLGQLLQMSGQVNEANEHFRRAIKFAPGLLEAHYNLAVNLTTRGSRSDKMEAVKRMREALPYADPSHPNRYDLMFLLAKTLDSLDRVPEACRVYEEIIQSSPSLWKAHFALGRIYLKLDNTTKAMKSLSTAALLQPHDSQIHYQLALCHYRSNNFAESAKECEKALELCADGSALPNANLLRGKLYVNEGQWAKALDCFQNLVRLRPDQPDGYYQVARALEKLGRINESDAALCQILECWSRQIARMPAANSKRFFESRPADARILDLIGARCQAQSHSPEHHALVRKYNALQAAVM